ncbi:MAG: folylpolyglutamate synthase/dihydrofolate synthase family protein [Candidatus Omnitrophota bacterium]
MYYPAAIKYLELFINYEKISDYPYKESLKLERIRNFLDLIGRPQDHLKCIHVAGTKGKGSTCAFIAYILREAGFKTGLYTSPHLIDFRERIRILSEDDLRIPRRERSRPFPTLRSAPKDFEGMISRADLVKTLESIRPEIEKFNKTSEYGPLTFFEAYTALAFEYFKDKKTDFVVLETGLGGRLDATNVVNALVSVITPVSYEHTQKLGKTLKKIAGEKAGIIKDHRPQTTDHRLKTIVVSAPQEKEAQSVIRKRCKEAGVKLIEINKPEKIKINLIGRHQLINATVALNAIKTLKEHGFRISNAAIKNGLAKTIWPGRCEVIAKKPTVVVDGAQNIASARAIKEAIKENFKYNKLILILGISDDKDIKGICAELYGLADIVILTKSNNPRAAKPEMIAQCFKDKEIKITQSIKEVKNVVYKLAGKKDLILVTGSLFVVGEFRARHSEPRS